MKKNEELLWNIQLNGTPTEARNISGEFLNLTPHDINVVLSDNTIKIIPTSGSIARVKQRMDHPYIVNGIPIYKQLYGDIIDLPLPKSGLFLIVSIIVKSAYEYHNKNNRYDLIVPSNLVKDNNGKILYCKSFVR